jgi:hypothetical protein
VFPLDCTDTRAYWIRGYFAQMTNYQDFWSINLLKDLCYIFKAPCYILIFQLWFVMGELNFPKSSGSPCTRGCLIYWFKWPLWNEKCSVLYLEWCYKAKDGREQVLWRYSLSAGYIEQWYDKPTGDGFLRKSVSWGAMKQGHCCILCSEGKAPDNGHNSARNMLSGVQVNK